MWDPTKFYGTSKEATRFPSRETLASAAALTISRLWQQGEGVSSPYPTKRKLYGDCDLVIFLQVCSSKIAEKHMYFEDNGANLLMFISSYLGSFELHMLLCLTNLRDLWVRPMPSGVFCSNMWLFDLDSMVQFVRRPTILRKPCFCTSINRHKKRVVYFDLLLPL